MVALSRQNLEGCLAKRKLEAAKFLWFRGLELMSRGDDDGGGGSGGDDSTRAKTDRTR